ncbi:uncharacterized protein LOC122380087 isoform X2 [Amphibalanus amphitrite]|uniref:uncharacterized protein LOC122380087 isoform X2 n=1 Tax=Amphibalanus amphitrite TaxID=1232801 RepID=UPI001C90102A|nr:uncharacterized protein LOC122380087 isoform X2 [Amphibalanus amphitrite]
MNINKGAVTAILQSTNRGDEGVMAAVQTADDSGQFACYILPGDPPDEEMLQKIKTEPDPEAVAWSLAQANGDPLAGAGDRLLCASERSARAGNPSPCASGRSEVAKKHSEVACNQSSADAGDQSAGTNDRPPGTSDPSAGTSSQSLTRSDLTAPPTPCTVTSDCRAAAAPAPPDNGPASAGPANNAGSSRPPKKRSAPASRGPPKKKVTSSRKSSEPEFRHLAMGTLAEVRANTVRIMELLEGAPRSARSKDSCDEKQLRAARSMKDISEASGGILVVDEQKGVVYCSLCLRRDPAAAVGHQKRNTAGWFQYDMSLGTSFDYTESLPNAFRSLKTALKSHLFRSSVHMKLAQKHTSPKLTHQNEFPRAMNLLRTAYLVTRFSGSEQSFSDLIALQMLNGAEICHADPEALLPLARHTFYSEIMNKLKEHIATQPCVSVLASKVTVNGMHFSVVMVLTVVPAAPPEHLVQSFVVGVWQVADLDGDWTAKKIQAALDAIGVRAAEQLAAIAVGDEYRVLRVPSRLLRLMRDTTGRPHPAGLLVVPLRTSEPTSSQAEAQARAQPDCQWVSRVISDVELISARFAAGGDSERPAPAPAGPDGATTVVRPFSDTATVSEKAASLEKFFEKWKRMEAVLGKRLEEQRDNPNDAVAREKLADGDFKARVAALCDLYWLLNESGGGGGSGGQARRRLPPWEARYGGAGAAATMRCMHSCVNTCKTLSCGESLADAELQRLFPTLAHHAEVLSKGCLASDITAFCEAVEAALRPGGRLVPSGRDLMLRSSDDLRAVTDLRDSVTKATDVTAACRRLMARRMIPSEVAALHNSPDTVVRVLQQMSSRATLDNEELFGRLWNLRWARPSLRHHLDAWVRLWLLAPPRGVIEAVTAVIGEVASAGGDGLSENAAEEIAIRWNGPELAHADPLLETSYALLLKQIRTGADKAQRKSAAERPCPRASLFKSLDD